VSSPIADIANLSPAQLTDARKGMAWWNELSVGSRRYWLLVTQGGSVAQCWEAYKTHVFKPETLEQIGQLITGTPGPLRCFEVREDGAHLVKVYDAGRALQYAASMRANPENTGRVYTIHEVRP
jgi:hypothetical protein